MTRTLPKQLETREAKSQSTRLLTEKATHRSAALRSQSWKVTASPVWTDLLPLTVSARLPSPGGKYNQDERDAVSTTNRDIPHSLAPTKGAQWPLKVSGKNWLQ